MEIFAIIGIITVSIIALPLLLLCLSIILGFLGICLSAILGLLGIGGFKWINKTTKYTRSYYLNGKKVSKEEYDNG